MTRALYDGARTGSPPGRFTDAAGWTYRASGRVRDERRAAAGAIGAAIASLAAVTILWLTGGGLSDVSTSGAATTSLGRISGLIASDLLLIQVLAMARIPWIERSLGQDRLTRWHRWIGFTSFSLIIVHILLITIGYAQSSGTSLVAQAWDFIVDYPAVLLAVGGTLALVLVVVTSIRAARRRLRYESWHLIHLYAYVGAGLVLPHQLWAGQDFVSSTGASVLWWGLWGTTAAMVICFRIALPLWRSARHRLTVSSVIPAGRGVYSVVMSGRDLDRVGLHAGQFCHWRFLSGRGWTRAHPYTIASRPTPGKLQITVQQAGDGSNAIAGLRRGTRVLFEGPYGRMTADRRTRRDVALIASGVGITPMLGLAQSICAEPPAGGPGGYRYPSVVVLYRIGQRPDALFVDDFARLARTGRCHLIPLVGSRDPAGGWLPRQQGRPGHDVLRHLLPDIAERAVYVCGNDDWMREVRNSLRRCGVRSTQIHCERFAN